MCKLLSLLTSRSRRRVVSIALSLLENGYVPEDVSRLLQLAQAEALKAPDIRNLQKECHALKSESTKLRKQIARQEDARQKLEAEVARLELFKEPLGPSEQACKVLAVSQGHRRTVVEQACVDASGALLPGFTYPASDYLGQLDLAAKSVFEYGSGSSTHYWSQRVRKVTSVDHDAASPERLASLGPLRDNVEHLVAATVEEYSGMITRQPGKFDIIVLQGEDRPKCVPPSLGMLSDEGMIILDHSDWHPATAALLRAADLIEVDMQGFGPQDNHLWTTSFFFKRNASFQPGKARQPTPSTGSNYVVRDSTIQPGIEKPALNGLDEKLAPYLDFQGGLFIEAGANDGFAQSNTFRLENSLGWKGILIEAVPDLAEKAKLNRARSTVYNCALVADEKETPTVTVHFCNLMSVVEDKFPSRKAMEEHIAAGVAEQKLAGTYTIEVQGRTLTAVLDEFNPQREIDFFSLDVEGYELEVLKGLDFTKYAPKLLLVETSRHEEVTALLSGRGYEVVEKLTVHDYLFRRGTP